LQYIGRGWIDHFLHHSFLSTKFKNELIVQSNFLGLALSLKL
jgi:hypothetical protein